MSKSQPNKRNGWAFILGSFALVLNFFADSFGPAHFLALPANLLSSVLLAVGLMGLRARYGERAGGFGRNILLTGVVGMVLLYAVITFLWILYAMHGPFLRNPSENLWILIFGGPAILSLALALFGLSTLRCRTMTRLSWLSVLAGIPYPAFYFYVFAYIFANNGAYPHQYQNAFNAIILLQFFALCSLGIIQMMDAPQEAATA